MRMLMNKILVKPIIEKTTDSGIEIPMNSEEVAKGTVVNLAHNVTELQVGDTIGHNLAFDELSEDNRVVDISDVYCVYEEGDC